MFHYVARRKQMVKIFFFFFQSNSFSFVVLVHAYRKKKFHESGTINFPESRRIWTKGNLEFFSYVDTRKKNNLFTCHLSFFVF